MPAVFSESMLGGATREVIFRLEPQSDTQFETVVRENTTDNRTINLSRPEFTQVAGGLGDPFRALMQVPGVSAVASGAGYPIVRGMQPTATAYFVDGVRIPALYHLFLGAAVISPDFIESISLSFGAPRVELGRFLGAAVEAQVSERQDGLAFTAYADLLNVGAHVAFGAPETGSRVSASGRVGYSALAVALLGRALLPADAEGHGQQPSAALYDYQVRAEQRIGPGSLRVLALGSSDFIGLEHQNPGRVDLFAETVFHRVDVRWSQSFRHGRLALGATWGREHAGYSARSGDGIHRADYGFAAQSFGTRFEGVLSILSTVRLALGGDFEQQRSETSTPSLLSEVSAPSPLLLPEAIATSLGAFAAVRWTSADSRWNASVGGRVDSFHLVPGIQYFAPGPRAALRFALTEKVLIQTSFALQHQPPTSLVPLPAIESAGLRYGLQEAARFDLGAEWHPVSGVSMTVGTYYSNLLRAIELEPADVLRRSYSESGVADTIRTGSAVGLEVTIRKHLSDRWFGWISYAISRSDRNRRFVRLDPHGDFLAWDEQSVPFAFDQTHVVNAAVSYLFPGGLTAGVSLHLNSGRPESGQVTSRTSRLVEHDGQRLWVPVDLDAVDRLPPFVRVDARISKRWLLDDATLELYLDVQNASFSKEVVGYTYGSSAPGGIGEKTPIGLPIVLPMLGMRLMY